VISRTHKTLLGSYLGAINDCALEYHPTGNTYRSHALHMQPDGNLDHHRSCLDHALTACAIAMVTLLDDASTDHRPLLISLASKSRRTLTSKLFRRNFGALMTAALEPALHAVDWSPIYASEEADFIQRFIAEAISKVLDVVCPTKLIVTKKSNSGLYLSRETREVMARRDSTSGKKLKVLRNRVVKLVKRDRIQSTLKSLCDRPGDHRLLWQLANRGLGKAPAALPPSLVTPSGTMTSTEAESASVLNSFYIEKVVKLREKLEVHCHPQNSPSSPRSAPNSQNKYFEFKFAN
jgi:hypothetical protein